MQIRHYLICGSDDDDDISDDIDDDSKGKG
jgi:hypothetical protein